MASANVRKSDEIIHQGGMRGVELDSYARVNTLTLKHHSSRIDAEKWGGSDNGISNFANEHF